MNTCYRFLFFLFMLSVMPFMARAQAILRSPAPNSVEENLRISAEKEQDGDFRGASDFLNRAAMIESERKNFAKAIEYYERSLTLNEKLNNQSGIAGIHSNLAMLYNDMGAYEKALFFFYKTLAVRKAQREREAIFDAMFNIAMVLKNLSRTEEAIRTLEEALSFSQENYDLIKMRLCYGTLYELYEKKGDTQKMAYYYSYYMSFNNRIYNQEKRKLKNEIAVANDRAREAELEKKIAVLEKERDLKAKQIELNKANDEKKFLFSQLSEEQKFIQHLEQEKRILEQANVLVNQEKELLAKAKALKDAEVGKEKAKKDLLLRDATYKNRLLWFGLAAFLAVSALLVATLFVNLARKRANKQLKEKQDDLSQANRVKDKMFSIIAHDLRAPFTGIRGLLMLLERDLLDEKERQDLLKQLKTVADATLETLENLLRWAKGQIQGIQALPAPVRLHQLAENSIQLLSENAKNKHIIVSNMLPIQAEALADNDHIDIIIRNLLSNAIKFTPKDGWVTITGKLVEDVWRVEVRDSGVGIPAEKLPLLFDADNHISTRGTDNEKGTGLGLILVKELLEKNGGTLHIESKMYFGTSIFFTLPVATASKQVSQEAVLV